MTKSLRNDLSSMTTRLLYADRELGYDTDCVAPPIHQSVTHVAEDAAHFAQLAEEPLNDRFYARHGNPTSSRLAKVIAEMEGGEAGMIFSSGMGATTTALMTFLKAGDHVVLQSNHYMGTMEVASHVLPKYGVEYTLVDQRDSDAFEAAVRPNTRMILLETPVNPVMHVTDLKTVCDMARSKGILTFCDNTFATPVNQRPMELGVDIVMHSATKYIGGHHDLLAGSLTASQELMEQIWDMSMHTGSIPAPFNSWLALRGIRTMELRVGQQNQNAMAVAEFLESHSAVEEVFYPGLKSHPQHELAASQMSGFGGLFTFSLRGGMKAGEEFIAGLQMVDNAGSLGGVWSVVNQPAVLFGGRLTDAQLLEQGIDPGMIRFACGIENTQDLLADVDQALGRIGRS